MTSQQTTQTLAQRPTEYAFDLAHSSAEFSVKHLMIATVKGRMAITGGHVRYDPARPEDARIVAELAADSIHTGDEKRDGHLRSPDFLDAAQFPTLRFESDRVEQVDEERYRVYGRLTIRGATRSVVLDVEHEGRAKDPWGKTHDALVARTTIDRSEWGLSWNAALETGGVLVGDKVKVELNLQLIGAQ